MPPCAMESAFTGTKRGSVNSRGARGYEEWEAEFRPLLGHTARWEGFSYIVRDQLEREAPVIVETGSLRQPGNWEGDGGSTALWNWVGEGGGRVFSVDLQAPAVFFPAVTHITADSVGFLRNYWGPAPTLLYLDSYDYSPGQEVNAAMHQVAELGAIWAKLPAGCLIASDYSHGPDAGKPVLTRRLLAAIGMQPLLDSYIVVWRKS